MNLHHGCFYRLDVVKLAAMDESRSRIFEGTRRSELAAMDEFRSRILFETDVIELAAMDES